MKFSRPLLVLLFLIFSSSGQSQQRKDGVIFGTISSEAGEPLPGVTLILQGTTKGAMTDINGDFRISQVKPGTHILEIRYLGFAPVDKKIDLDLSEEYQFLLQLEEQAEEIDAVTVLGKSRTALVREQAFAVSAISTEDLYNSSTDVQQVLNRVPGVRILEEGGLGSDTNFTLNGFSGDQVKFFMDGIPMDHFGSSLSLSDIPVNSIERIEVYKGVVPVWLGTDALGGAVNIITNQDARFLDASYSIGSFNTHRASINGAYRNPFSGFTFRGNINYNYSDNDYKVWVPIREGSNIIEMAEVERFHDAYESISAKAEIGVVDKNYADRLLFGVLAGRSESEVQHGATMNSVYGGIMRNSKSFIPTLKYSKDDLFTEGLDLSFYSAYNITESEVIDTLSGVKYNWLGDPTHTEGSKDGEFRRTFTTITDDDLSARLNIGYAVTRQHSVALTYSFSNFSREIFDIENPESVENRFPKSLAKQVAGLAYKFDPNERWSSTLFTKYYQITAEGNKQYDFGLPTQRTDAFRESQSSIGYGLATAYFLLPQLQLKASYEHTYRMPTADEMFGDGLFIAPNPELGPEKSNNFNLGASYNLVLQDDHFLSLGSSFIYRNAEDLIYQVVKVASPQTRYDNLSETRTIGVEGNFGYEWGEFFHLGGNITFQNITDQADFVYNESYTNTGYQKNFQKGFRLPNTPYLFGNANAGFGFNNVFSAESRLGILYRFNYVEEYFLSWAELGSTDHKKIIPAQSSHDLELSYSFQNGRYNASFEVRNFTDERLYDKYFLQKPGRAFFLKLRYAL